MSLSAAAQELKIGIKTEPSSLDPQFHTLNPNIQVAQHFFDCAGAAGREPEAASPALALSWKTIDDTTWEFKLRPNVKFHDGSDFTAEDVVFTYERVPKVPNSPGPYTIYTRSMKSFEIVDPLTLRIKTNGPAPLLPLDLAALPILSKKAMAGPARRGQDLGRAQRRQRPGRHRPVQVRRMAARQPHRRRAQRQLLGREAGLVEGDPAAAQQQHRPRRRAAVGRRRPDRGSADHRPRQAQERSEDPSRPRGLQPRDLHPSRPARRAADRHPRHQRQEPAARQAGARGAVDRDRPQGHRRQDHGRRRGAGGRPAALPDGRHEEGHAGRPVRSGQGQEAAGRGGLSQRLLDHPGRAERPLHQRPQDRPGGRRRCGAASASRPRSTPPRRRCSSRTATASSTRPTWRAGAPAPASSATR